MSSALRDTCLRTDEYNTSAVEASNKSREIISNQLDYLVYLAIYLYYIENTQQTTNRREKQGRGGITSVNAVQA